jgi:hypothetical protein
MDLESNAGSSDAADVAFDANIDTAFILGLTILAVKFCRLCAKRSDELNPFERGSHPRSATYPCWPWWQGTYANPRGLVCRACMLTFMVGSFSQEHASIDDFLTACKASQTLLDEFLACVAKLIALTNEGKMPSRLRGKKRSHITDMLQDERRRTVNLVKSEGMRVMSRFSGIPVEDWKKENPKGDISAQLVKKINYPGRGMIDCVLLAKGPANSVDVDLETTMHSTFPEELESGIDMLRTKQADTKYSKASHALMDIARNRSLAQEESYSIGERSSGSKGADGVGPREAGNGEDAKSDDDEDDENDSGGEGDLLSSLLAEYVPVSKEKPAAVVKPKAKSSTAKPAAKLLGRASQSSQPVVDLDEEMESAADGATKKGCGKGKRSKIPTDPQDLLRHEGFFALTSKGAAISSVLSNKEFTSSCMLPASSKAYEAACKSAGAAYNKVFNEMSALETKVGRRTITPEEAVELIKQAKAEMRSMSSLFNELAKTNVNWERCQELLNEIPKDSKIHKSPSIMLRLHRTRLYDLASFGKIQAIEEMHGMLDTAFFQKQN